MCFICLIKYSDRFISNIITVMLYWCILFFDYYPWDCMKLSDHRICGITLWTPTRLVSVELLVFNFYFSTYSSRKIFPFLTLILWVHWNIHAYNMIHLCRTSGVWGHTLTVREVSGYWEVEKCDSKLNN